MFIDLRELLRSGKEKSAFFFEYTPEDELLEIPDVKIEGPIKVAGEVTLTSAHCAFVEGEVTFSLKGKCTRCLEEAENVYVFEFREECGGDGDNYSVINDRIDLDKIVDDTVIMNTHVNFLCRESCKGICAGCGVNLNNAECKCK